ncbi:AraC family transcriptional regulator [Xylanibacillus composti]|uniref:AraC family transcriptional regulator n=1 Tax=Xylanibacillus composti TaxID=1572762 RepID=A0A8J4M4R3_9BACL|nr:AraC family transcriptional regulator [Xylanibacillus composti]MDT9726950.1 AraC family transcriptional regulator [Xylanibacillus composti]MDT9727201.1 AraC family transcriptional regulator [Xylanibacillus composti]GIQ71510.1 AraC family transcriptional regulator [Xylanibacillus composti]
MLQPFNQLMDYIEAHLTEEISGKDIATIVGMSDYHFKRMFSYMAGMSLQAYIKNRRLSVANVELINGAKVTDVAYKYGFQSVEGFSRAFREWSGFLPSEVAKNHIQKTFPKFTFFIDIRGGVSMEFKLEKKEKFHIVGVSKRVPIQFEGENHAIIELAQSITEQQRKEMHQLADLYPHQVLNVSYDFDDGYLEEKGCLTHMIGFATTQDNPFDDLEQLAIEESLWAIFPNQGPFPATLQETTAKIYAEWLPSSGYEAADLPGISFTKFGDSSDNVYSEIWMAVKEKKV